jgi:hypothetical protein
LFLSAAIGAVYSTTTCLSSKITGYDDGINHFFGGCAAGAIIGARGEQVFSQIGTSQFSTCNHFIVLFMGCANMRHCWLSLMFPILSKERHVISFNDDNLLLH